MPRRQRDRRHRSVKPGDAAQLPDRELHIVDDSSSHIIDSGALHQNLLNPQGFRIQRLSGDSRPPRPRILGIVDKQPTDRSGSIRA